MSDDLHKLLDTYKKHLINIDQIIGYINEALSSIPNIKTFKAGRKFMIEGGLEDEEAQVLTEDN